VEHLIDEERNPRVCGSKDNGGQFFFRIAGRLLFWKLQDISQPHKGNRLSLRTAEDNFANIVKTAGPFDIPRVVPHTLRHCFASHALETEKDLVVVKAILGHALMRSTEIYLHPSLRLMRKCADAHVAAETVGEARTHRKWIRGIQKRKAG
jgi:integrase